MLNQQLPARGDQRHRLRLRRRPFLPTFSVYIEVYKGYETARRVFSRAELINQYYYQDRQHQKRLFISKYSVYLPIPLSLCVHTHPGTQIRQRRWLTDLLSFMLTGECMVYRESVSEHTKKMYMFQTIYTYLCIYTPLVQHTSYRQRGAAEQVGMYIRGACDVSAYTKHTTQTRTQDSTQQKERNEHDKNHLHLCTEPEQQQDIPLVGKDRKAMTTRRRPSQPCTSTIHTSRSSTRRPVSQLHI